MSKIVSVKNTKLLSATATTTLKGAFITNKDASGVDQGNLQLTTRKLIAEDIQDHDNYKNSNVGLGVGSVDFNPSLNSIEFAKSTQDKEQIVRATTNSDTSHINRDIVKTKQLTKDESSDIELYASDSSINALTHPVQTYKDMKQKAKDVGLASHVEILKSLPTAKGKTVTKTVNGKKVSVQVREDGSEKSGFEKFVDNTLGKGLDKIAFLGILPSKLNDGGYVSQIATQVFGDNRNILQTTVEEKFTDLGLSKERGDYIVTTINGQTTYITNPDKTVRITKNGEKEGYLDSMKIYISEEDAKKMKIDHLFTNGIMNSFPEALANQKEQQGSPSVSLLNYNQTHGLAGDSLEMTQEKIAITTNLTQLATGGARQTGEIKTQLTRLNNGNLKTAAHSQGTMQDYLGTKLNKETISNIVQNNKDAKYTTQYSGSPVNSNAAQELVTDIYGGTNGIEERFGKDKDAIENVFRSQVNPGDPVALLGGNTAGINNHDDVLVNISEASTHGLWTLFSGKDGEGIFGFLNNPNNPSPHSGYGCVIGCGDGGVTPKFGQYIGVDKQDPDFLQNFYLKINADPTISNVYNPAILSGEKK